MTFDEAMHHECEWCGEMAMNHRLTDGGNFYCLVPNGNPYMVASFKRETPAKTKLWAMNRAKCNELKKSPLPKSVATVIIENWRTLPAPVGDQMELA